MRNCIGHIALQCDFGRFDAEMGPERVQPEPDPVLARDIGTSDRARARDASTRPHIGFKSSENSSRPGRERAGGGQPTDRVGLKLSNTRPTSVGYRAGVGFKM